MPHPTSHLLLHIITFALSHYDYQHISTVKRMPNPIFEAIGLTVVGSGLIIARVWYLCAASGFRIEDFLMIMVSVSDCSQCTTHSIILILIKIASSSTYLKWHSYVAPEPNSMGLPTTASPWTRESRLVWTPRNTRPEFLGPRHSSQAY
jgi:hypothetical protein